MIGAVPNSWWGLIPPLPVNDSK
ncbi:hypothetical protein [Pantoea phage LIMEzero]|uniref:Uncharacterized protein n=1 Tax=Pantoea phage LIMEzero TaxID=943335 RepID=F4N9Q6_9CAUD|nr:hypothetical protein LIMEzero_ORF03 [Pantoea phage LIMEzero]CBY88534.1 hypothetical protein [Pantoea phage LIMEzero]